MLADGCGRYWFVIGVASFSVRLISGHAQTPLDRNMPPQLAIHRGASVPQVRAVFLVLVADVFKEIAVRYQRQFSAVEVH